MLLKDLKKVYISEYEEIEDHGETTKKWKYKGFAWLNMQQDVNQLDAGPTGEINHELYKARIDRGYNIQNGNGVSLTDISKLESFIPEYKIIDQSKIGNASTYRLEKIK